MNADHSVFLGQGGIIVTVYVDDLLRFGPEIAPIEALKHELNKAFDMKDLGPCAYYLGMHITRDRAARTIRLSQEKYIEKVLSEFGMLDLNPVATPIEAGLKLTSETEKQAPEAWIHLYQSAVGSLIYAMIKTRPDITFVVSKLSIYTSNPSNESSAALKPVI